VDVDAPHLQEILRRAYHHPGTAFVEILQNCPVYNDDEWIELEDRKQRVEASLVLRDGEPLVYGGKAGRKGIRIEAGIPSIVELGEDEDPVARGVAIHNERHRSPAYAFALASLHRPDFPLPIGVFRAVETSTYEGGLERLERAAIERRGSGDLDALLRSGETWVVEE
jgi:2-oxoglutarate ferredoxin oxidoreductase subunit beta